MSDTCPCCGRPKPEIWATEPRVWWGEPNPYTNNQITHVHIEVDIADPRYPLQRHVWHYLDGTTHTEAWIRSVGTPTPEALAARGYARRD